MIFSKLLKSALCVVCFVSYGISAQGASVEPISKSKIITLDTVQLVPLDITLYKPEQENPLAGQVGYSGKNGTDVEYQLFDDNGALVWSKFQEITDRERVEGLYEFKFKDVDLQGEFDFKVTILNKYGDRLGEANNKIFFEDGSSYLDIKDLTILSKPDSLKVGFIFENDRVSRKVLPKVEIYHGDKSHRLVKEVKLEQIGMGGKQKKRFTLDVEKDFAPGLYLLEASVISPEGKAMTGVLQSSFFRKGNYVKINEYEFLLDEYEKNKKVGVWFSGRILEDSDEAVEVILVVREGNDVLQEKNIPLNVDKNGKFTGNFSFSFDKLVPQFSGDLKIKKGEKVLWESVLESPVFKIKEEIVAPVINVDPALEIKKEEKGLPIYFYTIAIVIFAMLALLLVLRMAKKQTFIWLILLGSGVLNFGNVFAEDVHTIYWNHPVQGWGFSQNAGDFSQLHIEGAIFDPITGNGFFDTDPTEIRINFSDGINEKEYIIDNVNYSDERTYEATIDLSNGYTELGTLNEGELNIIILFKKDGDWYGTPAGEFAIVLDNEAPEILDFNLPTDVEATNDETTVNITCTDSGIGCFDEKKILTDLNPAVPFLSFQEYAVKGNFCENNYNCDTSGAKGFEICDGIGNCTDAELDENELTINWYDPVPPLIGALNIWEELISSDPDTSLKAFGGQSIAFDYDDPNTIDKDSIENEDDFDDHACGDEDFFEKDDICKQKIIPCVLDKDNYSKRGKQVADSSGNYGACTGDCPSGYEIDGDYCIRECTDDRFYPTAMCFGYDSDNDGEGDSFCLDGSCLVQ